MGIKSAPKVNGFIKMATESFMVFCFLLIAVVSFTPRSLHSEEGPLPSGTPESYREFIQRIRPFSGFLADIPIEGGFLVNYSFEWGEPEKEAPTLSDIYLSPTSPYFYRTFIDRIFLKDGSTLKIGKESVPLTCLFIFGQDNRFSGKTSPLIPDFLLRVYLVANDFSCTGPLNPAWPAATARKENWNTYLYYEVRDPTIMLPVESRIRYRWNEFNLVKTEQEEG